MNKHSLKDLSTDEVMALEEDEAVKLMDQILRASKKAGIPVPSVRTILWPNALVKAMIFHYRNSFSEDAYRRFEEVLQIDEEEKLEEERSIESLLEEAGSDSLLSRSISDKELAQCLPCLNRSDLKQLAKFFSIDSDLKNKDLIARLLSIKEEELAKAIKKNFPEKFVDPTSIDECFILGDLETFVWNLSDVDHKRVFTEFFAEFKIRVDPGSPGIPHLFLFEDVIDFEEGKRVIKKVLGQMTKA